jgi:hypothetical protein
MTDREWLDGLKAGDEVAIPYGFRPLWGFKKIERLTKTQIILVGGGRFRRKGGRSVAGGLWDGATIYRPNQEMRDSNRQARLANRMREVKWHILPVDVLTAVAVILDEHDEKTPND